MNHSCNVLYCIFTILIVVPAKAGRWELGIYMQLTKEDILLFEQARDKIIEKEKQHRGIGTLGEKTTHAILKHYIDPREQYHEQRCGSYVADILCEGEIIEIQTANFNVLRRKLEAFLQEYDVTVVYPICAVKWLIWINPETGEATNKRKSPKTGSYYQIFQELYKIKSYLTHPRLHFRLILMDVEEYRLLNGWSNDKKKGSTRFDRIPLTLKEEYLIVSPGDFAGLIPESLPEQFLSRDFKKEARLPMAKAQTALNVLTYVEAVERIGKEGNNIVYKRKA